MSNFVEFICEVKKDEIVYIHPPIQEQDNEGRFLVISYHKGIIGRYHAFQTQEEAQALYDLLRGKKEQTPNKPFDDCNPGDRTIYNKLEKYKFSEKDEETPEPNLAKIEINKPSIEAKCSKCGAPSIHIKNDNDAACYIKLHSCGNCGNRSIDLECKPEEGNIEYLTAKPTEKYSSVSIRNGIPIDITEEIKLHEKYLKTQQKLEKIRSIVEDWELHEGEFSPNEPYNDKELIYSIKSILEEK